MAKHERPFFVDLLLYIGLGVVLAFLIRAFVVENYLVPSGSMLETIQIGDHLFGEKITYHLRDPEPGDVVTFDSPVEPSTTLIKRVIATEGQTVDLQDGKVVVDGQALVEPYTGGKPSDPLAQHAPGVAISYPYTLKAGEVWVMGDNRTNSADSRYFGPIQKSSISSRAWVIFWPFADAKMF